MEFFQSLTLPGHGACVWHREPVLLRLAACAGLLSALPRRLDGEQVTTIAYDLRYSSPAAFTMMFKQRVGVAPNTYRKNTSKSPDGLGLSAMVEQSRYLPGLLIPRACGLNPPRKCL
jgi:hypothetical protein